MSVLYRSEPRDYSKGAQFTFPTSYIDPARKLSAPVIEKKFIRFTGHVTPANVTGTGKMPQAMLALLLDKILLQDQAGDRCNVEGLSLLAIDQQENGLSGENYGPDLATGGSRACTFYWEIPFTPKKARRRNDFGLSLNEFLDGGKIQINVAADPTLNGAVVSVDDGQFDLISIVREERQPEAKSRIVWLDYEIGQTEYTYPINGSMRYFLHRVEAADWVNGVNLRNAVGSGGIIDLTSRTIDYAQIPDDFVRQQYLLESEAQFPDGVSQALGSRSEDLCTSGFVLPVISPRNDEKIGSMFNMTGMHYKFVSEDGNTVPTGKVVFSSITDRQPSLMARTLKAPSMGALTTALGKFGRVHSAKTGADTGLSEWNGAVAARLPVTFRK